MNKEEFKNKYPNLFRRNGVLKGGIDSYYWRQWFIICAREKFGNKYDYSRIGNITKNTDKVCIICPIHGEFYQTVNHHLDSTKVGCTTCAGKIVTDTPSFINKSVEMHGLKKYDYSRVVYKDTDTPVKIFCNLCSEYFFQKPHYHIAGSNCQKCSGRYYNFLYVLKHDNLVKIGISNNPTDRIKSVSRSLGVPWVLYRLYKSDNGDCKSLESSLHFLFKSYRYRNLEARDGYTEVFKLGRQELNALISVISGMPLKGVDVHG